MAPGALTLIFLPPGAIPWREDRHTPLNANCVHTFNNGFEDLVLVVTSIDLAFDSDASLYSWAFEFAAPARPIAQFKEGSSAGAAPDYGGFADWRGYLPLYPEDAISVLGGTGDTLEANWGTVCAGYLLPARIGLPFE